MAKQAPPPVFPPPQDLFGTRPGRRLVQVRKSAHSAVFVLDPFPELVGPVHPLEMLACLPLAFETEVQAGPAIPEEGKQTGRCLLHRLPCRMRVYESPWACCMSLKQVSKTMQMAVACPLRRHSQKDLLTFDVVQATQAAVGLAIQS